ncbi:MAG TPA: PAS domain-containing protein [Steroidobacteraceae bacterium]|nr:PAS domain-containing protein [Steroidobacteraceae bacterium]
MKSLDSTQLLPLPTWNDPRVHLLDDLWLVTIVAILFAAGLPWLLSSFDIRFGAALLGLLALAAVHVGFTVLTAPAPGIHPWRKRALSILHAAGVVAVALIWHYAGGIHNPAFLIVFVLPVIGAIFLSRWQPYVIAILAILAAAAVALSESPELRWYATGLVPQVSWLTGLFGGPSVASEPFPGFYAPPAYFVVLLQVFAILMAACAFAAEYLGSVFDRLHADHVAARVEAERAQQLWANLIEELPLPAALVDTRTLQVVSQSTELAALSVDGAPAVGRKLTEMIHFSYPEIVEELANGIGGTAQHVAVHRGAELCLARVRAQPVPYKGRRLALILIEEMTEAFAIRAALDVAQQAIVVVDSQDRVLAFNRPALALFSATRVGADAETLLAQPDAPPRWWEPGLTGRRKMHLRIVPRLFQVTSTAVAMPGEQERLCVIAFLPLARAESLEATLLSAQLPGAILPRTR